MVPTVPVKHVSTIVGRIGWHGLSTDDYDTIGEFLVTGTEMLGGRVAWDRCHRVSTAIWERDPRIQLSEGDLLVSKDGTIGKVALVDTLPGRATLNSGVFRVTPKEGLLFPRFGFWVFQSRLLAAFVDLLGAGSTINHLYQADFVNFKVPLPSLDDQRAIADYLDRETARIEALIAAKRRMVELAEDRVRLMAYERTTAEGNVLPLRRVLRTIKTGTTPPSAEFSRLSDGSLPWYSPGDVGEWLRLGPAARSMKREAIAEGWVPQFAPGSTLVVGIGATAGRIAFLNHVASGNQQMTCLMPGAEIAPRFLAWQLWARQDELRATAPYTTLPILNNDFIKSVSMVVPLLAHQEVVVAELDDAATGYAALIGRVSRQMDLLRERRTALITGAVTGELDIRQAA